MTARKNKFQRQYRLAASSLAASVPRSRLAASAARSKLEAEEEAGEEDLRAGEEEAGDGDEPDDFGGSMLGRYGMKVNKMARPRT